MAENNHSILSTSLPLFPSTKLHLALYTDVTNSLAIRSNLLSGNKSYSYAFLDPTTTLSLTHVFAAIYRAFTARAAQSMRTKTLNTELVFSMSPSMNIADGLRKFGIKDDSTSLLVIRIDEDGTLSSLELANALDEIIAGNRIQISDESLAKLVDCEVVRQNYKIPAGVDLSDLNNATKVAIGAIALRGYT
ncbi:kinase binding protein CGI-121-domain-containing protein [Lipomyces oligophaga]|uniref:kinase binding protein CGI-121-domain-containing protein n=1 Tax=Lipomyces oligophaga TaxID=45792 RepID=UPI0034CD9A86